MNCRISVVVLRIVLIRLDCLIYGSYNVSKLNDWEDSMVNKIDKLFCFFTRYNYMIPFEKYQ